MRVAPIYLDHAATTPVRPEVRQAMEPFLAGTFGNPSSSHRWGREASSALDRARRTVAEALEADDHHVHFVRGGTEGDNLAVLGRVRAALGSGETEPLVAISAVEHSAVRDLAPPLEAMGCRVVRIPVSPEGALAEDTLGRVLDEGATVVSVMWVNNETGTVFPVSGLASRAREAGVCLHSDAVQAVGKVPVSLTDGGPDLTVLTGHKLQGPKGTGALIVRRKTELAPLLFGGGQEGGIRPGTQDVAGAAGLAEAVRLAVEERDEESRRLAELRDDLEDRLAERIPGLRVHGGAGPRAPHIANVGIPDADPDTLLSALDVEGLAVSAGSACSSGSSRTSPVLRAMYGEEAEGRAPVRYSLGGDTGPEEVREAAERTVRVVRRLRAL